MWQTGSIIINGKKFKFEAKVFDQPSTYGIDGWGKISKLEIRLDNKIVCNYDRGWDIKINENDTDLLAAYTKIYRNFN